MSGKPPGVLRLDNVPGKARSLGRMPSEGGMIDIPRYFVGSPLIGFEGDLEYTVLYAGESCSLVNDIKPAAAIVRDVVTEAEAVLRELQS